MSEGDRTTDASPSTPSAPTPYDPASFWSERFEGSVTLSTSADITLGDRYNRWVYRSMQAGVRRALRRAGVGVDGARIVDVGSGTGAWLEFWARDGARELAAVDISAAALEHLSRAFPEVRTHGGDVSAGSFVTDAGLEPGGAHGVSMVNVAFHMADDAAFTRAIANAAQLLTPCGWLLITDLMAEQRVVRASYEIHRSRADYLGAFAACGLEPVAFEPLTVISLPPLAPAAGSGGLTPVVARALNLAVLATAHRSSTAWLCEPLGALARVSDALGRVLVRRSVSSNAMVARRRPL